MKFLTKKEITEWYGPKCKSYAAGCPTCFMWQQYEFLKQIEKDHKEIRKDLQEEGKMP